jgi:hypothetical protein
MLTLPEIEKNYPDNLKGYKHFILREYLQHKILQIVFDSKYASHLSFLGGTWQMQKKWFYFQITSNKSI